MGRAARLGIPVSFLQVGMDEPDEFDEALTLALLAESSRAGYPMMCQPAMWQTYRRSGVDVLALERKLRAAAAEHGIDLSSYPNANLAETNLGGLPC